MADGEDFADAVVWVDERTPRSGANHRPLQPSPASHGRVHASSTLCPSCDKRSFVSRRSAKEASRARPGGEYLRQYPCPAGTGWHLGHLAEDIIAGRVGRSRRTKPRRQSRRGRGA